jgi:hypothetical protein
MSEVHVVEGQASDAKATLVSTHKLGLASYIQINGGVLRQVSGKVFTFLSNFTLQQWDVRYMNSECSRHDHAVMQLRTMINRPKPPKE